MDISRSIAERLVHNRMKKLYESTDSVYKKKVEKILNHRLGSYETGVSVDDIKVISETPSAIALKVDYSVDIDIPYYDSETQGTYYEHETEYRSETMTFDSKELNEDLTLDDDPEETEQQYSSAATSINSSKLPAIFHMVDFKEGSINLDYGGGRFDNAAEYLQDQYGATNLVYDKYNRSAEHNKDVLNQIRQNGGADTVTCSNVLNVIAEESERLAVLRNCKRYLKSGGTCYITVYEGTGKGEGAPTKSGYQLNRKTAAYEDEIKKVFSSVTRKGKLFICR